MLRSEAGGKTIALEGAWGSGKSTTVELLREELEDEQNTVFTFDAWAHRGDPLRRSFLEELVAHLDREGWIHKGRSEEKGSWSAKLDELARRVENTTVVSSPRLTSLGELAVVLVALVPVGLGLYAASDIALGWQVVGGLFLAGPGLLALVVLLWRGRRHAGESSPSGDDDLGDAVLGVLLNSVQERTESAKVRTPDPTSVEFRVIFADLLDDALGGQDRRLLLVIDNLDRIDSEEAQTVWATMRTFFEFGLGQAPEWLERFWLLVPYAPESLRRLWRDPPDADSDQGTMRPSPEEAAESFVDKSFQVRFRASPPVLSDWRAYFSKQLRTALPGHQDEDEQYTLFQIYSQSREQLRRRITPRDVKLFINQVGALHRQWQDELPLVAQALYAAFRTRITGPEAIVDPTFVSERLKRLLGDPELSRQLAALYYNVEPNKALQVLMDGPLELALSKGSTEELSSLQEVPGFADVLFDHVETQLESWKKSEPQALSRAGSVISQLSDGLRSPVRRRLWRTLSAGAREAQDWTPFDETTGRGLLRILEHTSGSDREALESELLARISEGCPTVEEVVAESEELNQWVFGAAHLLSGLVQTHNDEQAGIGEHDAVVTVPGPPTTYLATLRALEAREIPAAIRERFLPANSAVEIRDELTRQVEVGELEEVTVPIVRFLNGLDVEWDWQPLGAATAQALYFDNELDPILLPTVCQLLVQLEAWGAVGSKHVKQLTLQGHLFHRLHQAKRTNDERTIAACLLPLYLYHPSGGHESVVGQAAAGSELYVSYRDQPEKHAGVVAELAAFIVTFRHVARLLEDGSYRSSAKSLTIHLLSEITRAGELSQAISAPKVVEEFSFLRNEVLGESEFQKLLREYGSRGSLQVALQEIPVAVESAEKHLMAYSAIADQDASAPYRDHLVAGLSAIPEDVWNSELNEVGSLISLLRSLQERGVQFTLTTTFSGALHDHFRRVLRGEVHPVEPGDWGGILGALEDHTRDVLLSRMLRMLSVEEAGHKHQGT